MNYALTFVSIFFSYFVFSQDTLKKDSSVLLENVIISYRAISITPNTFQNITKREIDEKSIGQEPSFLLSSTPSVTNYSDAGSGNGYSYFRMRGIDQTRINITLDGVPLNEPEDQGTYFSNYPDLFNSISSIQIQRGVGTSKNGVSSYGGSIQLFSPNSSDSSYTSLGLSYGSFNSLRVFGEYNSGLKKNKSFYARLTQVYSDGYKYHSSNNSQSAFLSGTLTHKRSFFKINALFGQQKNQLAWIGVDDSLISIDRRTNANSTENDVFLQSLISIHNTFTFSKNSKIQSSVYHTFLKGNYDFDLNNFLGLSSTDELYNYAFLSNLAGFYSNYLFNRKNLNWISGIHVNHYERSHTGSERSLGKLYENKGLKNEFSSFSKLEYNSKLFVYFVDIQFRHTDFDYKGNAKFEKLNWNFLNPKAGVTFKMNSRSNIFLSLGKTSREPTRNDLFYGNDDLPADSLGNGILKFTDPEEVIDFELGYRIQLKKFELNANLYYMDFKNEIVLDGKFGPNGIALTNKVDNSYRTGFELNLNYKLNSFFTIITNSSLNFSEVTQQSERFVPILTPCYIINQEVQFNLKKLILSTSIRYQSKSFIDYANTESVNEYVLLNARISYSYKRINFSAFINNILNSKYINQAYIDFDGRRKSFVQAPLNYSLTLNYTF